MGGIYKKGTRLYVWFFNADGERIFKKTACKVGQEASARRTLEDIERRVEAERRLGIPSGELTVKAYGERWMKGRPAQGVVTAEKEAQRLRSHAWPLIGNVLLKDLRPHHIRDMVRSLRGKNSAKGKLLAPRTVRHVYGTVHTLLHDAVVDELISATPCVLKAGELPGKIDSDPEWRAGAVFTREEAEALISDERLPEDRRVWNGILFLSGLRFGEAAALRWRHYDASLSPLGRLAVASTWDAEQEMETSTKTERPRAVPVHPTLAKLLAAWKLGGYERVFEHAPGPDDLILPGRNGEHRNPRRALLRFHADLDMLGFRRRRQHDSRRTFVSLAQTDGALPHILKWITHGPEGDIVSLYTTLPWPTLCGEVSKLRVELREGQLLQFPMVAAAGVCPPCASQNDHTKKPPSHGDLRAFLPTRSRGLERGGTPVEERDQSGNPTDSLTEIPAEPCATVGASDNMGTKAHDAIAEALNDARYRWGRERNARALRRALLDLLRGLEDDE